MINGKLLMVAGQESCSGLMMLYGLLSGDNRKEIFQLASNCFKFHKDAEPRSMYVVS